MNKRIFVNRRIKRAIAGLLTMLLLISSAGCGKSPEEPAISVENETALSDSEQRVHSTEISGELTYDHSMELSYATGFAVDYYEEGYALLTVERDGQYLVVPEGQQAPEDLDDEITVLYQPLTNVYLVASAVMDMYVTLDVLDDLRFSALEAEDWYIEEARDQMESGKLLYAGKYSAPDYERILSEGCSLAIENTMIYHNPEVKEQLERFDIPVLVDYSSYESNPLGRMEWIKLYGVLADRQDQAEEVFRAQEQLFAEAGASENTGLTVAFFYITSTGAVNVRKSTDYLPKMIEMAGGTYIFAELGSDEESASSTVTMQMEEFYAVAKEADYIIYNSTIDGELGSVEDLLAKSPLLENFKAVQEDHVYCTGKNLYQSSMELGTITSDIHNMLMGEDEELTFLYHVQGR